VVIAVHSATHVLCKGVRAGRLGVRVQEQWLSVCRHVDMECSVGTFIGFAVSSTGRPSVGVGLCGNGGAGDVQSIVYILCEDTASAAIHAMLAASVFEKPSMCVLSMLRVCALAVGSWATLVPSQE
jgi:hypothetical protein